MSRKGLSEKELFEMLMQSSDEEPDRDVTEDLSDVSDIDDAEPEPEINEEHPSFQELEEEAIDLPVQSEDEARSDGQSYEVNGRVWSTRAPKTSKSRSSNILREKKGLTNRSNNVSSIIDCFKLFFSEDLMEIVMKYTNKKARDFIKSYNDNHTNPVEPWIDVDSTEMQAFLGILILSGRFHESNDSARNLWSTTNPAFNRPIYQATMSRDRFVSILRHLRFDDLSTRPERKLHDKLAPIREITEILGKNCRESFNPSACGTIDEQLVSFRGRCPFKVYIPSKPGKYGIKVWTLCDAETFYCCNFEVYLGKVNNTAEKNQGPRVVKTLSSHWCGSGR